MASHLAAVGAPLVAVRPVELGLTGIQGRRAIRRNSLRAQVRGVLLRPHGRHRVTFIPVDDYSLHAD